MFCCNFLGSRFGRIVHHGDMVVVDVGDDLITEREESILVGFFIFMNVDRRDFKGTIPLCADFIVVHAFIVLLDVDHQHMEMQ